MNQLENDELEEIQGMTTEEKERFFIENLDSLNWAMRKLKVLKEKKFENETLANSEIERIQKWLMKENKALSDSANFFENLIREYHMKELEENPKAKTISTPYGKATSRKKGATPVVSDETTLKKYITDNDLPYLTTLEPKVNWKDFKSTLNVVESNGAMIAVDEYGQIVEGVKIEPETTTFKVEV